MLIYGLRSRYPLSKAKMTREGSSHIQVEGGTASNLGIGQSLMLPQVAILKSSKNGFLIRFCTPKLGQSSKLLSQSSFKVCMQMSFNNDIATGAMPLVQSLTKNQPKS